MLAEPSSGATGGMNSAGSVTPTTGQHGSAGEDTDTDAALAYGSVMDWRPLPCASGNRTMSARPS